jgi:hypothetical protein
MPFINSSVLFHFIVFVILTAQAPCLSLIPQCISSHLLATNHKSEEKKAILDKWIKADAAR